MTDPLLDPSPTYKQRLRIGGGQDYIVTVASERPFRVLALTVLLDPEFTDGKTTTIVGHDSGRITEAEYADVLESDARQFRADGANK